MFSKNFLMIFFTKKKRLKIMYCFLFPRRLTRRGAKSQGKNNVAVGAQRESRSEESTEDGNPQPLSPPALHPNMIS